MTECARGSAQEAFHFHELDKTRSAFPYSCSERRTGGTGSQRAWTLTREKVGICIHIIYLIHVGL